MADTENQTGTADPSRLAMTAYLQIAALTLLIYLCYTIVSPFISLVVWGLIIAVTLYPAHLWLSAKFGGKQGRSATLLVILGLVTLLLPVIMMLDSSVDSARGIATGLRDGTITISPPRDGVAEWPLVGERIHGVWSAASQNLQETLRRFETQLATVGESILRNLGSTALGILQFALSLIVAGIFLVNGKSGYQLSRNLASSVTPQRGHELVDLSIATIRSVTKGVLGVAIVQTALAVIGLVAMGIPGAGIWGAIVLLLAVMQLPPWLVLLPISLWVFSVADTVPATIFFIYSMVVSISDMFLKPLFLGRGVDVPMPVILIGAIGGAIGAGIVGLFVGAVVLAIGYELLVAWIYPDLERDQAPAE